MAEVRVEPLVLDQPELTPFEGRWKEEDARVNKIRRASVQPDPLSKWGVDWKVLFLKLKALERWLVED